MIISGGGTGGHVYPAIAIADTFRQRYPQAEILFVGAQGKMEMIRVPEAGYRIVGLWISGFRRSLSISNLMFPVKLAVSLVKAASLLKKFKPHVVVGTGGYASGPVMLAAARKHIPAVIQEQNAYAGLVNKQVAEKASCICVAYDGMEKYFPKDKLVVTGNPVRKDIIDVASKRDRALAHFGLDPGKRTVLVLGGSGGARTINDSIIEGAHRFSAEGIQVLWATGKFYYDAYANRISPPVAASIKVVDFIREMDLAYAVADVVVSRAGALSISELCVAGKAVVLVPSPNVAEDHQTKNAMALVNKNAGIMVTDATAREKLVNEVLNLLNKDDLRRSLQENISAMARPNAAEQIVDEIEKLIA